MAALSYRLSDLIARFGGQLVGDDVRVNQLATLSSATEQQLSFFTQHKYRTQLQTTRAAAVLISGKAQSLSALPRIVCDDPLLYAAQVATLFSPPQAAVAGIHPQAYVAKSARIAASAQIAALVSIGEGVSIGENSIIQSGCCVGDNVHIGDDCLLWNNVSIYHGCRLGHRVIIHAGAVIGADGFGQAWTGEAWYKIPQLGIVQIGNDVEIGANTTIDRGALDDTIIEDGAKLDNQIQIAHNVHIGRHTAIAGCAAIAGSTRIGGYCKIGGAAMIIGHLDIADYVTIMAGTFVSKSIRSADSYSGHYPCQSYTQWKSNAVHLRHLDRLVQRVSHLEEAMTHRVDDI